MPLINIGFGNIINTDKIDVIVSPESAPVKRVIQEARDDKRHVDATYGRRTRAVIITESNHVICVAMQPETILGRCNKNGKKALADPEDDE